MDMEYTEDMIPEQEFFVPLTAYPVAVNASTIDVQVEVEEIG
jgi:hypothetical protein